MQKAFLIVFGHFTFGETTNIHKEGDAILLQKWHEITESPASLANSKKALDKSFTNLYDFNKR